MVRTVGEVARLAGITVRTLHHYDDIGLVCPSARSAAGYRLYTRADLERLQQVLLHRELGFALEDIRSLLLDPDFDRGEALRRQRDQIEAQAHRAQALVTALDMAVRAHETGINMTDEEMFEVFGDDLDREGYAAEARERWGDTDAYRQSMERTRRYTKEDWQAVKEEMGAVTRRLADLMAAGVPPDDVEAMDAAEAHRRHIHERFYDCSHRMQVGLAEMYVGDPRFTAFYDELRSGLAVYVHDAIVANAARAEAT